MAWRNARERGQTYVATFAGPTGKLVLDDLKSVCRYNRSTFDANPHVTAFNEGMRTVLLLILSTMASADNPAEPEEEDSIGNE